VVDNDTNAKESRLKLNASGFTYFLTPDIAWVMDVGLFAKAPDGVGHCLAALVVQYL
jgi:autophagy-related protein 2